MSRVTREPIDAIPKKEEKTIREVLYEMGDCINDIDNCLSSVALIISGGDGSAINENPEQDTTCIVGLAEYFLDRLVEIRQCLKSEVLEKL